MRVRGHGLGITLRGCGMNNTVNGISDANTNVTTLLCNTGTVCIDTTGSSYIRIQDMNLETRNSFSTPSTVGIMMGRDAASGAQGAFCFSQLVSFDRLFITADRHTAVNSGYGFVGLYNIGSEHFLMSNSRIWVDTPAWFSTANDLGLGSPYQNLQNGCPASMTLVTLINDSFLMVSGHGIIAGGNTHDFQLINQHWLGATGGWPIVFSGTSHSNWYIRGQIEQISAPAGFITTGAGLDHIDADVATADQTGNGLGYISFFSNNCCTISNSKFKVTVLNGVAQPMVQNAFETFIGGEIDLSTTAINSPTGITVVGTIVQASDRSTSQVNFAAASSYMVLGSDQISFQGTVNFAGPHN